MLAFDPNQRLSLADLIGHPWMQGPHATHAEIREEIASRLDLIKTEKKA